MTTPRASEADREPSTEAGRAMVAGLRERPPAGIDLAVFRDAIVRIENEARSAASPERVSLVDEALRKALAVSQSVDQQVRGRVEVDADALRAALASTDSADSDTAPLVRSDAVPATEWADLIAQIEALRGQTSRDERYDLGWDDAVLAVLAILRSDAGEGQSRG